MGARPLACALLLSACSTGDEPVDGLSADERRQLNEAAQMLDDDRGALNAVVVDDGEGALR